MKTAIVYASTHHGNTKKLLDAIAAAYEVDLIDAVKIPEKDLNRYDLFYQHPRRQSGLYFDRKSADSQKQRPSGKIWLQGL